MEGYWIISDTGNNFKLHQHFMIKCDLHILHLELTLAAMLCELEMKVEMLSN